MTKIIKIDSCFECATKYTIDYPDFSKCPFFKLNLEDRGKVNSKIQDDCPLEDYQENCEGTSFKATKRLGP